MLEKIKDGRTDMVFELLKNGVSAKKKDEYGTAMIKWCAYHGDVSAIKFLLSQGESLNALGDNLGLNACCFHGHWQLCQFLIESGADVNEVNHTTGESPLHLALCKANRPVYDLIIELLVDAGADPNVQTQSLATTGSFMRDCKTKGETPLHRAAAFGTERSIALLVNAGANLKATDMNGDSPLTWASWHLRPAQILRMLCYDNHTIHPDNHSDYDHGTGWGQMDSHLSGKPHI